MAVARVGAETIGRPGPQWLRELRRAEGTSCQDLGCARSFPAPDRQPLQNQIRACCERRAPLPPQQSTLGCPCPSS